MVCVFSPNSSRFSTLPRTLKCMLAIDNHNCVSLTMSSQCLFLVRNPFLKMCRKIAANSAALRCIRQYLQLFDEWCWKKNVSGLYLEFRKHFIFCLYVSTICNCSHSPVTLCFVIWLAFCVFISAPIIPISMQFALLQLKCAVGPKTLCSWKRQRYSELCTVCRNFHKCECMCVPFQAERRLMESCTCCRCRHRRGLTPAPPPTPARHVMGDGARPLRWLCVLVSFNPRSSIHLFFTSGL